LHGVGLASFAQREDFFVDFDFFTDEGGEGVGFNDAGA
jgi:hypothetical protein